MQWLTEAATAGFSEAALEPAYREIESDMSERPVSDETASGSDHLMALGAEAVGNPQPEFAAFVQAETDRWGRIIRDKGIRPE